MKDDLSELLNEWQPAVPEPADFRRGVWARIEAAAPRPGWLEQLLALVARPRAALAMAALVVVAGGVAGNYFAQSAGAADYLRAVNPYSGVR